MNDTDVHHYSSSLPECTFLIANVRHRSGNGCNGALTPFKSTRTAYGAFPFTQPSEAGLPLEKVSGLVEAISR